MVVLLVCLSDGLLLTTQLCKEECNRLAAFSQRGAGVFTCAGSCEQEGPCRSAGLVQHQQGSLRSGVEAADAGDYPPCDGCHAGVCSEACEARGEVAIPHL